MRLDLPRHNCVSFELQGELTPLGDSDASFQDLMELTYAQRIENDTLAIFASRYVIRGTIHKVQGVIVRIEDGEESNFQVSIAVTRASSSLPRPPRTMRPVSRLLEVASDLFDKVNASCTASFEYKSSEGYRSRVVLPIVLPIEPDRSGVTHIESAQFSRRDGDSVEYRVAVLPSDDFDGFLHVVNFDDSIPLDQASIRGLLTKAGSFSNSLVTETVED